MERKLYFFAILFVFNSLSWGWSSFKAKVGGQVTFPYQSSNPTVELKTTRNINQQQSEDCYLYAFAGALEMANLNAWKRPISPEISGEYLFVQKMMAWTKEALTSGLPLNQGFYFVEGGDVHHAMKLSVEIGLLPQELFRPKVPFANWDFPALYRDMKAIAIEGRKVLASVQDPALKNQILQLVLKKAQDRIGQEAGIQPQQFTWGGRKWTVHTFENAFGIKRNSHIFMMYPQGQWDMGNPWDLRKAVLGLVETFHGAFNYSQGSWNQIWQYLLGSIDSGLPAMLSMKWHGSYHVLNVVGYEYNNRSEIVSFKLKNSWGDDYGDHGHAYFGLQDLQKNITSVWGFKTP